PGSADRSYGIQVARLAGLPDEVLVRAKEVLMNFEEELTNSGKARSLLRDVSMRGQMDLFLTGLDPLVLELIHLDLTKITSRAALAKLRELKSRAEAQAFSNRP
ncbi:MAG TPA: hypothetical protein VED67_01205, partial [Thermodesulfovibrionales bacterium]|nr:hypothetical protein [Thermodesulfovibrionales bacterium]